MSLWLLFKTICKLWTFQRFTVPTRISDPQLRAFMNLSRAKEVLYQDREVKTTFQKNAGTEVAEIMGETRGSHEEETVAPTSMAVLSI